jgi:hypothetical protein
MTFGRICEAASGTGRLETGERSMGGLPNDHTFGAIGRILDPYLTRMETVESGN